MILYSISVVIFFILIILLVTNSVRDYNKVAPISKRVGDWLTGKTK